MHPALDAPHTEWFTTRLESHRKDQSMAIFETTRTQSAPVGGFFSALIAAVISWNDARVTRTALSRLSDRELEDIGLCRGDIDYVSRQS